MGGRSFVVVEDSGEALLDLAAAERRRLTATVVGITGSTGKTTTKDLTAAVLILMGTGLFVRSLPSICDAALFPRVRWDAGLRYTFLTLSRYGLIFLGLWWGLSTVHMNWSSIQWIVAAVSVGVGFGLQEIVSNFVSGLILLLERPIRVDDIVTVGDQTGTVKRITIRATAIQNGDNQTVIIHNKEFIAHQVSCYPWALPMAATWTS